ncbi:hypothetical protein SERLA73DRAFT_148787 [Serpula lacrymans var. lacrymans S7.3]|uniref:Uncharacterized protein n=1 Tax=Serpula lacrymans var. lacrymans (strain S7.3) TaxID=936435 RepID=F8PEU4_SERL3|nr:hypothetical protein SERLA73DRAFT_148787 [Serpula lacrymans var. lacrymans S7.3]
MAWMQTHTFIMEAISISVHCRTFYTLCILILVEHFRGFTWIFFVFVDVSTDDYISTVECYLLTLDQYDDCCRELDETHSYFEDADAKVKAAKAHILKLEAQVAVLEKQAATLLHCSICLAFFDNKSAYINHKKKYTNDIETFNFKTSFQRITIQKEMIQKESTRELVEMTIILLKLWIKWWHQLTSLKFQIKHYNKT